MCALIALIFMLYVSHAIIDKLCNAENVYSFIDLNQITLYHI